MVPNLIESETIDEQNVMHITVTNLDLEKSYPIDATILGSHAKEIKGEIVTGQMGDKNTFENPEEVKVEPFNEVTETKEGIQFTIPACSVLHLAVSL